MDGFNVEAERCDRKLLSVRGMASSAFVEDCRRLRVAAYEAHAAKS